ncbi:MAG: hypothetical protein LBI79_01195 [Nitrososphaerota archaeon]|nr:hypothetical protein [Nitrososphaerota archaeon]
MKFQFWRDQISKKFQDLTFRLKSKRALLGVDAGILIAFFTITMLVIYLATPVIMSTLFNIILGGPDGIYTYLLELPLITEPSRNSGTIGQQLGVLCSACLA